LELPQPATSASVMDTEAMEDKMRMGLSFDTVQTR
jgi:hypothetical protein